MSKVCSCLPVLKSHCTRIESRPPLHTDAQQGRRKLGNRELTRRFSKEGSRGKLR